MLKKLEIKLNDYFKSEGIGTNLTKTFIDLDLDEQKAMEVAKELSEGFKKALEEKLREKLQGSSPSSSSGNAGKDDKSDIDVLAV